MVVWHPSSLSMTQHVSNQTHCLCGIVQFQKISTPPPQRDFFLRPSSHPLFNFQLSSIHFFTFLGLKEPPPPPSPGKSNPFCGGSMEISWNCTLSFHEQLLVMFQKIPRVQSVTENIRVKHFYLDSALCTVHVQIIH